MTSDPGLWAGALGTGLLHTLGVGALLAAVAAIALRACGRSPARVRYAVAFGALLSIAGVAITAVAAAGSDAAPAPGWLQALGFVWLAGTAVYAIRLGHGLVLVHRLRQTATSASEPWPARLARTARFMGMVNEVALLESSGVTVPGSIGGVRPAVIFPAGVVEGVSERDFTAIAAHELAHLLRHDYEWNLLQRVCEAVLWCHPARPWLSRVIRHERERCCDELSARACHPVTLARGLVRLERARRDVDATRQSARSWELAERIEALVMRPSPELSGGLFFRPSPAAVAAGAGLAAVLMVAAGGWWPGSVSPADTWPWLVAAGTGLLIGARHALEPDHVAAVATLVSGARGPAMAARLGAWWGVGHGVSLLIVGALLVLARSSMPPVVESALEVMVAIMLVVMGLRALWTAARLAKGGPTTTHAHGGVTHTHAASGAHVHVGGWTFASRPLGVGLVHGLAGSGALTAMAAAAMPDAAAQVVFLLAFGAGATAGMAVAAGVAGRAVARIVRAGAAQAAVSAATGVAALLVGAGWAWPVVRQLL